MLRATLEEVVESGRLGLWEILGYPAFGYPALSGFRISGTSVRRGMIATAFSDLSESGFGDMSEADDDNYDPGADEKQIEETKMIFDDPDPICTYFRNCPNKKTGDNTGLDQNGNPDGQNGNALKNGGGGLDLAIDEAMVDASVVSPCDPFGRVEMGGRILGTEEHVYCDDPHKRGYNVCVSVMPGDFANRTGGFCYNSTLNNAASSQWFFDNVRKWKFYNIDRPNMKPPRIKNYARDHRPVQVGLADAFEVKDTEGKWWPITLTAEDPRTHLFEGIVYNRQRTSVGQVSSVDAKNIRAYGGGEKLIDAGDRVVRSEYGIQNASGGRLGTTDVGTVVKRQGNTVTVAFVYGPQIVTESYPSTFLQHAGMFELQLERLRYIQLDGDYMWRHGSGELVAATVTAINNNGSVRLETFNPVTEQWGSADQIKKHELFAVPGIDTGKTVNVCKQHTGMPWCITSRALHRYLTGPDSQHAAIEVNCDATKDRKKLTRTAGSNCARNLRLKPGFKIFRMGDDDGWRDDGFIDWEDAKRMA